MAPKKPKKSKDNIHSNNQAVAVNQGLNPTKMEGSYITLVIMALALMMPLFFRGSFFPREQHLSQLALMVLFMGWMFRETLQGGRLTLSRDPWPLILGLLVIAYILPVVTFQWASLDQAIGMVIWHIALLFMYWLVRENITEKGLAPYLMDLWIVAGLIVATVGLWSLAGYGDITDAVLGRNRIASYFQYPNTLAAFLMGLFFVANGRMLSADTLKKKALYAGAGWWMMLIFILTYSRAAWLIFPIMAAGYWVLMPREDKLPLLFYDTITAVTLLLALQPIVRLTPGPEETEPRMLLTALAGLLVAVVLFALVQKVADLLKGRFEKVAYGAFALAAVAGIGFMVMAYNVTEPLHFENTGEEPRTQSIQRTVEGVYPGDYQLNLELDAQGGEEGQWPWLVRVDAVDEAGTRSRIFQHAAEPEETGSFSFDFQVPEETAGLMVFFQNRFPETAVTFSEASITAMESDWVYDIPLFYKYIPEALVARFESIDIEERSASTRVAYYRDGMEMFKSHPVGMGGGAWEQAYRQFQSEPYTSRQTHNYYLQVLVEAGVVGILTILAFLGLLLLGLYQTFRWGNKLGVSLYIGLLAALGHSALDFNFGYFSFALFIWSLVALLPPLEEMKGLDAVMNKVKPRQAPALLMLLLVLPVLFVTGLRYSAMGQGATASAAASQGDIEATYHFLDSAIGRNPFHPLYRSDMVQLLTAVAQQGGQAELLQDAQQHLNSGFRYAPHHDSLMRQGISLYAFLGDTDQVLDFAEERADKMPLFIQMYESNIEMLNGYAKSWLRDETATERKDEAQRILAFNMTHLDRFLTANEMAERPMNVTGTLRTNLNETQALLYAMEENVDSQQLSDGFIFASFPTLEYQLGTERMWRLWNRDEGKLTSTLTAEGLVAVNEGTDLGIIYTPNLPLEPNTTYQVLVSFHEMSLQEPLRMHVIATDSEEHRVQVTHVHDADTDDLTATFSFTTSGDIDPEKDQYFRFDHPGNDAGSFTIKGMSIIQVSSVEN